MLPGCSKSPPGRSILYWFRNEPKSAAAAEFCSSYLIYVRQKYETIMEYVALIFVMIAFPLAIGAYYRIDKLEKELKVNNLIANNFDSNK